MDTAIPGIVWCNDCQRYHVTTEYRESIVSLTPRQHLLALIRCIDQVMQAPVIVTEDTTIAAREFVEAGAIWKNLYEHIRRVDKIECNDCYNFVRVMARLIIQHNPLEKALEFVRCKSFTAGCVYLDKMNCTVSDAYNALSVPNKPDMGGAAE